jgi:hypothetical protein
VFRGSPTNYLPHRGINREPFGIIGVFVTSQPAEDGLYASDQLRQHFD